MAETTPSALAMATMDAGVDQSAKAAPKTKPEKPDETVYKEQLAKIEKAFIAAQETFVCYIDTLDL